MAKNLEALLLSTPVRHERHASDHLRRVDFQSHETSVTFMPIRTIDLIMTSNQEETGSLNVAMKHASQLLESDSGSWAGVIATCHR